MLVHSAVAYWSDGLVATFLSLAMLLAIATPLAERIPASFPMPRAMVAGLIGFALGPSAADLLPVVREQMELVVYHGLALVFITVSLQRPVQSAARGTDVRSISLSIAALAVLQGLLGMILIVAMMLLGSGMHSGFGLLALLGFSQGPGQALSLGGAWEAHEGFTDGAQLGLIVASLGFVACTLFGSGWLGLERHRRGTASDPTPHPHTPELERGPLASAESDSGTHLIHHILVIAGVYLAAYLWLRIGDSLVADKPKLQNLRATMWGFHFLIGLGFAILYRYLQPKIPVLPRLDDRTLSGFSAVVVEFTTCAAVAAVSGAVFMRYAGPILTLGFLTAGGTLLGCIALRRWLFIKTPFEHGILLFGASTGTLLTGLALLRVVDPELRSDAASNQVMGVVGSIPLLAPVMLGVLPFLVGLHEDGSMRAPLVGVGIFGTYLAVLVGLMALNRRRAPAEEVASPSSG